jgi:hypothetical protein
MTIYTRRTVGNDLYTYVRCSTNTNRGGHICPNGNAVEIGRVIECVYDARVRDACSPAKLNRLVDAVLASYGTDRPDPKDGLQKELAAAKARAKNVLDAIATLGLQPDLAARYKTEQARVSELEARLAQAPEPPPTPTREDVLRVLAGLEDDPIQLKPDQVAAQLRERFARVEMHPEGDGWEVRAIPRFSVNWSSGGEI